MSLRNSVSEEARIRCIRFQIKILIPRIGFNAGINTERFPCYKTLPSCVCIAARDNEGEDSGWYIRIYWAFLGR